MARPDSPTSIIAGVNVTPNTNGLPGIAQLREIVGAMMTVALILSVLSCETRRPWGQQAQAFAAASVPPCRLIA